MVNGICPLLTEVTEAKTINIKTTPLAPVIAIFGKNSRFKTPETKAVTNIIFNRFFEPYFSSINPPKSSM